MKRAAYGVGCITIALVGLFGSLILVEKVAPTQLCRLFGKEFIADENEAINLGLAEAAKQLSARLQPDSVNLLKPETCCIVRADRSQNFGNVWDIQAHIKDRSQQIEAIHVKLHVCGTVAEVLTLNR